MLHSAVSQGNLNGVCIILAMGADVCARNNGVRSTPGVFSLQPNRSLLIHSPEEAPMLWFDPIELSSHFLREMSRSMMPPSKAEPT